MPFDKELFFKVDRDVSLLNSWDTVNPQAAVRAGLVLIEDVNEEEPFWLLPGLTEPNEDPMCFQTIIDEGYQPSIASQDSLPVLLKGMERGGARHSYWGLEAIDWSFSEWAINHHTDLGVTTIYPGGSVVNAILEPEVRLDCSGAKYLVVPGPDGMADIPDFIWMEGVVVPTDSRMFRELPEGVGTKEIEHSLIDIKTETLALLPGKRLARKRTGVNRFKREIKEGLYTVHTEKNLNISEAVKLLNRWTEQKTQSAPDEELGGYDEYVTGILWCRVLKKYAGISTWGLWDERKRRYLAVMSHLQFSSDWWGRVMNILNRSVNYAQDALFSIIAHHYMEGMVGMMNDGTLMGTNDPTWNHKQRFEPTLRPCVRTY